MQLDHPANRGVLAHLGDPGRLARSVSVATDRPGCAPGDVEQPYVRLGAHPEIVERLWDELGAALPADCRCIVFGTPALVHPVSGVIFAFGGGTLTYALRLPPDACAEALGAGATTVHVYPAYPDLGLEASSLDLGEIGPEWVFGAWHREEPRWCRAAYEFAAPA